MPKSPTQLDREIATALSCREGSAPAWLTSRTGPTVDPKVFRELIQKAVKFPEFKTPTRYTWQFIRGVPINELDPGSKFDYEIDPESDGEEAGENLSRYYRIERLLYHQGKRPWPIVVNGDGDVIDGFHRLAVLSDHGTETVDILWVRPKVHAQ